MRLALTTKEIGHYHFARYNALARSGVDAHVISLENEGKFPGFLAGTAPSFATHKLFNNAAAYAEALKAGLVGSKVECVLDDIAPDVVAVAGWASAESFAAIGWARRNGAGVVMMSDSQADDAARHPAKEWLKRRIIRYADAGFVAGTRHRAYLKALGLPEDRIALGYDAVDNSHFETGADAARREGAATYARYGLPARYLLASGRFIPKKNMPALIRAFGIATGADETVHLVVLGDGEERPAIEAACEATGVADRIHLHGYRGYTDLPAYYGLAIGFIHAATTEQWGLVISEAAAAGLPLALSHACGAVPELLRQGENGWSFDPSDTADIARAIGYLLSLSPQGVAAMGARSRELVADFGLDRFVAGLTTAGALAHDLAKARCAKPVAPLDRHIMKLLSQHIIDGVS